MHLHIERSSDFHNSVAMINDILPALNDFVIFNGEEVAVNSVEVYQIEDLRYSIDVIVKSGEDIPLSKRAENTIAVVGETANWIFTGDLDTVTHTEEGTMIALSDVPNVQMKNRED